VTRRAFTLWFTGLSGSGKTTLARETASELSRRSYRVALLDGDEVRQFLSPDLGFSKADRDLNIRRIGQMALLLARDGIVPIVAAISPYHDARREVRRSLGGTFIEIYLECALDTLIARDPKGLYAQALRGQIEHFTGISDPYEVPPSPDIIVRTDRESVDASLRRIVYQLEVRGLVPSPHRRLLDHPSPAQPSAGSVVTLGLNQT
jgi:adenylyl-sulfate kinase